jgi:hypothetical protein
MHIGMHLVFFGKPGVTVRFLVGANYGVDFKKNPLAGETGVRGFSKPGEGLFFLMKTVGRS